MTLHVSSRHSFRHRLSLPDDAFYYAIIFALLSSFLLPPYHRAPLSPLPCCRLRHYLPCFCCRRHDYQPRHWCRLIIITCRSQSIITIILFIAAAAAAIISPLVSLFSPPFFLPPLIASPFSPCRFAAAYFADVLMSASDTPRHSITLRHYRHTLAMMTPLYWCFQPLSMFTPPITLFAHFLSLPSLPTFSHIYYADARRHWCHAISPAIFAIAMLSMLRFEFHFLLLSDTTPAFSRQSLRHYYYITFAIFSATYCLLRFRFHAFFATWRCYFRAVIAFITPLIRRHYLRSAIMPPLFSPLIAAAIFAFAFLRRHYFTPPSFSPMSFRLLSVPPLFSPPSSRAITPLSSTLMMIHFLRRRHFRLFLLRYDAAYACFLRWYYFRCRRHAFDFRLRWLFLRLFTMSFSLSFAFSGYDFSSPSLSLFQAISLLLRGRRCCCRPDAADAACRAAWCCFRCYFTILIRYFAVFAIFIFADISMFSLRRRRFMIRHALSPSMPPPLSIIFFTFSSLRQPPCRYARWCRLMMLITLIDDAAADFFASIRHRFAAYAALIFRRWYRLPLMSPRFMSFSFFFCWLAFSPYCADVIFPDYRYYCCLLIAAFAAIAAFHDEFRQRRWVFFRHRWLLFMFSPLFRLIAPRHAAFFMLLISRLIISICDAYFDVSSDYFFHWDTMLIFRHAAAAIFFAVAAMIRAFSIHAFASSRHADYFRYYFFRCFRFSPY